MGMKEPNNLIILLQKLNFKTYKIGKNKRFNEKKNLKDVLLAIERRLRHELISLQFTLANGLIVLKHYFELKTKPVWNLNQTDFYKMNKEIFPITVEFFIQQTLKEIKTRSLVKLIEALGLDETHFLKNCLCKIEYIFKTF